MATTGEAGPGQVWLQHGLLLLVGQGVHELLCPGPLVSLAPGHVSKLFGVSPSSRVKPYHSRPRVYIGADVDVQRAGVAFGDPDTQLQSGRLRLAPVGGQQGPRTLNSCYFGPPDGITSSLVGILDTTEKFFSTSINFTRRLL